MPSPEPSDPCDLSGAPSPLEAARARLDCPFAPVQAALAGCLREADCHLGRAAQAAWLDCARALGKMGRGPGPVLALLQAWPQVAHSLGPGDAPAQGLLADVAALLQAMQASPNSGAMVPLLQSLPAVARRLRSVGPLRSYLQVVADTMAGTTLSLHGRHATLASPGLPVLLAQAPRVLGLLDVAGLARWAACGVRHHAGHPAQQRAYFALALPDSRAVLQRERHGTLLAHVERPLALLLRALWQDPVALRACPAALDDGPAPAPWSTHHTAHDSLCLPDAYGELNGVAGLDRYRVAVAHLAAHRRWSRPLLADNLSPLQRLSVECLEDARIDHLLLRRHPGLRPALLALHPRPAEGACDPQTASGLRHRLALLSRALLDPAHGYADPALTHCVAAFHALLGPGEVSSTEAMQALALQHAARTRRQSDQLARVHFEDTVVSYRDDNRHLWRFVEAGDEEDSFAPPRPAAAPHPAGLPPRLYPEWDASSQRHRPDWVSLYESLHPAGQAGLIDDLLVRHGALARRLQQLLDRLKPQERVRIRHQEDGSELDLDAAVAALIDWRAGRLPDTRILMRHRSDGRSIAVLVLLDMSESLNDPVPGTQQTRLALAQEAVALLAWAMDRLGDAFALAGFHSNTRHDVRFLHLKGFGERWGEAPKARLAALQARYSTRMGVALRHAARSLGAQPADKKLLLVLTDGRPSDVDVPDAQALVADSAQAVRELAQQGIRSHCISLDPEADAYVHGIFGAHATVVDRISQLPERLTRLFVSLTR